MNNDLLRLMAFWVAVSSSSTSFFSIILPFSSCNAERKEMQKLNLIKWKKLIELHE